MIIGGILIEECPDYRVVQIGKQGFHLVGGAGGAFAPP